MSEKEVYDGRQQYISRCKEENQKVLKPGKSMVQYIRKGKPEFVTVTIDGKDYKKKISTPPAIGALVAYRGDDNKVYVGYSLCNTKVDKFNRQIAMRKAIERAVTDGPDEAYAEWTDNIPQSVVEPLDHFLERAQRFFFKQKD